MNLVNGAQRNLSLRTATVTIRTLTIDNKQMTLAVFRQLPIIEILDYDKRKMIDGIDLWGIVRYEIKGYNNDVWIILQKDEVLYKTSYPNIEKLNTDPNLHLQGSISLGYVMQKVKERDLSKFDLFKFFDPRYNRSENEKNIVVKYIEKTEILPFIHNEKNGFYPIDKLEETLNNSWINMIHDYNKSTDYKKRYEEIKTLVESLPQLFIAI